MAVHERMAATLDEIVAEIARIRAHAKEQFDAEGRVDRPRWPALVLRTPKGWTGPHEVDGKLVEGTWRAHQVPLSETRDERRAPRPAGAVAAVLPARTSCSTARAGWSPSCARSTRAGRKRMSATPHANGGELLRDLRLPDFTEYAVDVPEPGSGPVGTTAVLGTWLRDVIRCNPDNFRMMAPDETASNRLQAVFEATDRQFLGDLVATDEGVAQVGRVTEVLSEHLCQGWLEGYLLTGRHGFFNCYEAFIHLVDSMFNQHAKWLDACRDIPWRRPIASLTYLLTSHVWRQDHNGFSHQDPGFVDHVLNKKPQIVRAYLPPDANTLLSTMDHCLRTAELRQRRRGRQAARPAVADHGRGRSRTAPAASGSGTGRATAATRSPTSCSAARATCPPSRPSRR